MKKDSSFVSIIAASLMRFLSEIRVSKTGTPFMLLGMAFLATGCAAGAAAGPLGLGIFTSVLICLSLLAGACADYSSSSGNGDGNGNGDPVPTSLKIFVTDESFDGNLGGVSGADAKCIAAFNKPDDGQTYKALIGADARSTASDWVLKASTEYTKIDGTVIGTTNAQATFDAPLDNAITPVTVYAWTGLNTDWTVGSSCNNWGTNYYLDSGRIGAPFYGSADAWGYRLEDCNYTHRLICVEQ